jgi:hypothetical protein
MIPHLGSKQAAAAAVAAASVVLEPTDGVCSAAAAAAAASFVLHARSHVFTNPTCCDVHDAHFYELSSILQASPFGICLSG